MAIQAYNVVNEEEGHKPGIVIHAINAWNSIEIKTF